LIETILSPTGCGEGEKAGSKEWIKLTERGFDRGGRGGRVKPGLGTAGVGPKNDGAPTRLGVFGSLNARKRERHVETTLQGGTVACAV